ncbi:MAG TPA: hypothetical protein VFL91_05930, partial [Thermomicrobiales bacterium]|nr:hypothetical protein [Thermomicrobiales bacterium]
TFPQAGGVALAATDDAAFAAGASGFAVTVYPPSALRVSPDALAFTATEGASPPPSQTLRLTADGALPLRWTASATTQSGGAWLIVAPDHGTAPGGGTAALTVSVATAGLAPDTYRGSLTVASPDAAPDSTPQTISITLTIEHRTHALALGVSPAGAGRVEADPPGGTYAEGATVMVTARPAAGWVFAGWTLDGAPAGAANPLSRAMDRDHALVARFAPASPAPSPSPSPPPPGSPPPAPSWSAWASQGGILTDAPAAAGFRGRVYVFARGSDNALYVTSSADGETFTGWRSLGGILTAAPAAASDGQRLYVFARGSDGALYLTVSADGATFGEWQNLGGILTAPPAATSVGGVLYVFAKGSDDALYVQSSADGAHWSGWRDLGGVLTAAPAAAGFRGQVYVFARGSDNALYEKHSADGGRFTDWRDLGGVLTAAPAAASSTPSGADETLALFARGVDGALYERRTTDGEFFTDWASLQGQVVGPPAAAGLPDRLFVFVRWIDDTLRSRHTAP